MKKIKILFCIIIACLTLPHAATHISQKPKPKTDPVTTIESYVSMSISLLSAVSDSTTMISGTLTYFRPFIFGSGIFDGREKSGFYLRAGYAIPWKETEYILGEGLIKDIIVFAGYRSVIPENYSDYSSHKSYDAVTMEIALDAVEWLNSLVGLQVLMSIGVNFWQDKWKDQPNMEPMMDLSVGLAF